ncbi:hypothetical protein Tco_0465698 [Tanacetum coccineum]
MDDDQKATKMKELMKIVPSEEEVAVDAIPLATKPPSIVDWKIVKEGKISYYQIIRADGSSKRCSAFIQMLKSFDREDLETLLRCRLVPSCFVIFDLEPLSLSFDFVKTVNGEVQLQALVDGKKIIATEASIRRDLQLDDEEADEDSMTLKELMEFCTKLQQIVIDLENTKTAQAKKITSLKLRVKKLKKKKGSRTHKLKRLYKIGRSVRIVSSDEASLGDQEDASKQGRNIDDIDADAGINLVSTHFDADTDMFGVHDLVGDEVFVESEVAVNKENTETVSTAKSKVSAANTLVSAATTTVADEVEMILAQTLKEIKSSKPKAKGDYYARAK